MRPRIARQSTSNSPRGHPLEQPAVSESVRKEGQAPRRHAPAASGGGERISPGLGTWHSARERSRWRRRRQSSSCERCGPSGGLPTSRCRKRCWMTCSPSRAGAAAPATASPGPSSSSATGRRCGGCRGWRGTSATWPGPPWRSSWSWTAIRTRSSRRPSTRGCSASGSSWPPRRTGWGPRSAGSTATGRQTAKDILGIPRERLVRTALSFGYEDAGAEGARSHPPQARKPLAEIVHHERFGGA